MDTYFPILAIIITLTGVAGIIVILLMAMKDMRELKKKEVDDRDVERDVVLDILLTNFVPEHLKYQIKAYMEGSIELEDLKEVMASVVKPGSGFVKYASKIKEKKEK